MKFVNKKLTFSQSEEFAKRKIKNPYGSFMDITEGIRPIYLTIDKSTDTWLAWCYRHRDASENVEEFLFMYKTNPIPVQAIWEICDKQVYWRITRMDIPHDLIADKTELKNVLSEAFIIYKASGSPDDDSEVCEVGFSCKL